MTTDTLIAVILIAGALWICAAAVAVGFFLQRRENETLLKLLGEALALVAKRDREIAELKDEAAQLDKKGAVDLMTIPAGRPIREVLDAMLLGFCEHHFDGKKFTDLDLADQLAVMERFEAELGMRVSRLKRFAKHALAGSRV